MPLENGRATNGLPDAEKERNSQSSSNNMTHKFNSSALKNTKATHNNKNNRNNANNNNQNNSSSNNNKTTYIDEHKQDNTANTTNASTATTTTTTTTTLKNNNKIEFSQTSSGSPAPTGTTTRSHTDREQQRNFWVERLRQPSSPITLEPHTERAACAVETPSSPRETFYENLHIAPGDIRLSKQLLLQKYFRSAEQNYALYENLCRGCGYGVFESRGKLCQFCECIVRGGVLQQQHQERKTQKHQQRIRQSQQHGKSQHDDSTPEDQPQGRSYTDENIYENVCYNCNDQQQCHLCSPSEDFTPIEDIQSCSQDSLLDADSSPSPHSASEKRSKSLSKARSDSGQGKRGLLQGFFFGTLKRVKNSKGSPPSTRPQIIHNVEGYENVFRTQESFDLQRICELKRAQTSASDHHIYGRLKGQTTPDYTPASTLSHASAASEKPFGKLSQSHDHLTQSNSNTSTNTKLNASEEQLATKPKGKSLFNVRLRRKESTKLEKEATKLRKESFKLQKDTPNTQKDSSSQKGSSKSLKESFKLQRESSKLLLKDSSPPLQPPKQSLYLPDSVCAWMKALRHEIHPYRTVGLPIDDEHILYFSNKSVPPARRALIYGAASSALLAALTNYDNIDEFCGVSGQAVQSSVAATDEPKGLPDEGEERQQADSEKVAEEEAISESVTLRRRHRRRSDSPVDATQRSPVDQMIQDFVRNLREKRQQQSHPPSVSEQQQQHEARREMKRSVELRAKRQAIYLKIDDRNLQLPGSASAAINGNNNSTSKNSNYNHNSNTPTTTSNTNNNSVNDNLNSQNNSAMTSKERLSNNNATSNDNNNCSATSNNNLNNNSRYNNTSGECKNNQNTTSTSQVETVAVAPLSDNSDDQFNCSHKPNQTEGTSHTDENDRNNNSNDTNTTAAASATTAAAADNCHGRPQQQQLGEPSTAGEHSLSRCLDRQGATSWKQADDDSFAPRGTEKVSTAVQAPLASNDRQVTETPAEAEPARENDCPKSEPPTEVEVHECSVSQREVKDCEAPERALVVLHTAGGTGNLTLQRIISDLALSAGVNRVVIAYSDNKELWLFLSSVYKIREYYEKYAALQPTELKQKFHKFRLFCQRNQRGREIKTAAAIAAAETAEPRPDVGATNESTSIERFEQHQHQIVESGLRKSAELDQFDGSSLPATDTTTPPSPLSMAVENFGECGANGAQSRFADAARSEVLADEAMSRPPTSTVEAKSVRPQVPARDPSTILTTVMETNSTGAVQRRVHSKQSGQAHEHRKMTVAAADAAAAAAAAADDIYQPIWKFQTRGEAQERYQTDADYFAVSRTIAEEQEELAVSCDESSSDEGEWETDDDFQFATQLEATATQAGAEGDIGVAAEPIGPGSSAYRPLPFDSCSLNSSTVRSTHSSHSSIGSTVTGFGSSTTTLASSLALAASLSHPIFRSVGIFYSVTDRQLRAIVYEYDRVHASLYFAAKKPLIAVHHNDSGIGRSPLPPERSPVPPPRTTSALAKTPSPPMTRSESDSKSKVLRPAPPPPAQGAVKAPSGKMHQQQPHTLPDSVLAWKFMLLDVNYMEDEEDMMVSTVAFQNLPKIQENARELQLTLHKQKSKSTQNLAEEKSKISSLSVFNKFQRRLKLVGGSPKSEKKSSGTYRRTDCNSLYSEEGLKPQYQIFGAPLHSLEMHKSLQVPRFVVDAVQLIEHKDCIRQDGLYRASGNKVYIDELKNKLTVSYIYDPKLLRTNDDIHTLTSLLKQFFRELPEPLIPENIYERLGPNLPESVDSIRQAFEDLPEPNLSTLSFIIKHLTNVAACSADNRMPASNLAIVWGPCLLSANRIEFNIGRMNTLAKVLIENYDRIFQSNERLVS